MQTVTSDVPSPGKNIGWQTGASASGCEAAMSSDDVGVVMLGFAMWKKIAGISLGYAKLIRLRRTNPTYNRFTAVTRPRVMGSHELSWQTGPSASGQPLGYAGLIRRRRP